MGWSNDLAPLLTVNSNGQIVFSRGTVTNGSPGGTDGIITTDPVFGDQARFFGATVVVTFSSIWRITGAGLDIFTAGSGLNVAEGANAKQGVATLAAGTVTVANTSVTAVSRIFLTAQDNNSTGALRISARTAGTGFTITSSNAADSGVVAYEIFEPG